jgi:hypothetical protein
MKAKCVRACSEKHCRHRKAHDIETYRNRNSYDMDCTMQIGNCPGCTPIIVKGMSKNKAHKNRHAELHNALDELAADFLDHTRKLLSKTTVLELLAWSCEQMKKPTEKK